MPRFANHSGSPQPRQAIEKCSNHAALEFQTGRQLYEHRGKLRSQMSDCLVKARYFGVTASQLIVVGDGARHLHREAEWCGGRLSPARIGCSQVRAIKGLVNLDAREMCAVVREVRLIRPSMISLCWRIAPTGEADTDPRRVAHGGPYTQIAGIGVVSPRGAAGELPSSAFAMLLGLL
jgi:hypothetical protein